MTMRSTVLAGAVLAALGLVACGGAGASPSLGASGAWARPTPSTAHDGVLYLTVTSDRADRLVAVDVPARVADHAELHQTTGPGGASHHHHGGGGGDGGDPAAMVGMEQARGVKVPAGGSVEFAPGGNHVMLVALAGPLRPGGDFTARLRFASGRTVSARVTVAENPPA